MDQLIKTNQLNILIRSLVLKKQKGDSSSKDAKGISMNESSRKRYLSVFSWIAMFGSLPCLSSCVCTGLELLMEIFINHYLVLSSVNL